MQGEFHNKRTPQHITDNPFYVLFTAISAQTNEAVSPSQDLSGILNYERFFVLFSLLFGFVQFVALSLRESDTDPALKD